MGMAGFDCQSITVMGGLVGGILGIVTSFYIFRFVVEGMIVTSFRIVQRHPVKASPTEK